MALLTKEQINEADDRPTLEIEIPEWGGHVLIRTLSGEQRDNFGASMLDKSGNATKLRNLHARFAAVVLVNEDGSPMYTEQQAAQHGIPFYIEKYINFSMKIVVVFHQGI